MQWSNNMVHSHFTLYLRTRDYIKRLLPTPMVRLLDESQGSSRVQGHGLGSCVKWPSMSHNFIQASLHPVGLCNRRYGYIASNALKFMPSMFNPSVMGQLPCLVMGCHEKSESVKPSFREIFCPQCSDFLFSNYLDQAHGVVDHHKPFKVLQ
jgi:hypothetical protein